MPRWTLLLSFLLLCGSVLGLHADEAGVSDWHKEFVGTPSFVHFGKGPKKSQLFVGTDRNVIAEVKLGSGKVAWRQVLEESDKLRTLKYDDDSLFSISGTHALHARLWNARSGFAQWDMPLNQSESGEEGGFDAVFYGSGVIALVDGERVVNFDASQGTVLWSVARKGYRYRTLTIVEKNLYVVGTTSGSSSPSRVSILVLDLSNGSVKSEYQPPESHVESDSDVFITGREGRSFVVWNNGNCWIHQLAGNEVQVQTFNQLFESGAQVVGVPIPFGDGNSDMILSTGKERLILWDSIGSENDKPVYTLSALSAQQWELLIGAEAHGSRFVARISGTIGQSSADVEVIDVSTKGSVVKTYTVPHNPATSGPIVKAHLHVYKRKDASLGIRLFAITADGSTRLFKEGEVAWSREEALAHVAAAEFVDLPEPSLLSQDRDELDEAPEETASITPLKRFMRRVRTHAVKIQTGLDYIVPAISDLSTSLFVPTTASRTGKIDMFRDPHGVRKLVVFATKSGKVVALDTVYGRTIWERFLEGMELVQIETVRTAVMKVPPLIVVVGKHEKGSAIYRLNALTGAPHALGDSSASAQFPVLEQVIRLPVEEAEERSLPLALVTADRKVMLYPDTAATQAAFEQVRPKFHFYLTEGEGSSRIEGFVVDKADPHSGAYRTKSAWNVQFPEGEKIAAIAVKNAHETVASLGRVLGNRSVLYKYLNPNLLALATLKANGQTSTVVLYLLDTVSGTIRYQASHPGGGASSPAIPSIFVAQSENWVVYSYWNHGPEAASAPVEVDPEDLTSEENGEKKKKRRKRRKAARTLVPDAKEWEIVALEVFENQKPDQKIDGNVLSSYNMQHPHVISQAYVLPHRVTAVGVTNTGAGITTREVLFGLDSGKLYGINKRWLDPRRPVGALSADDKEEGLIAYKAALDFNPREVASYDIDVPGIRHILTTPTSLESTTLVIAYGLDLFFSHRNPSKKFDVLSEDFSYVSLIVTIVVLVIGIWVSKYMMTEVDALSVPPAARKRLGLDTASPSAEPSSSQAPAKPTDKGVFGLPVLNGQYSTQNVAIHSFSLGVCTVVGLACGAWWDESLGWRPRAFALAIAAATLESALEYIARSMLQRETGMESFNNGYTPEHFVSLFGGIAEYIIKWQVWGWMWWTPFSEIEIDVISHREKGFGIMLLSQALRVAALLTSVFNKPLHAKLENSRSVFPYLTDPAETACFYWALGFHLLLSNPISFLAHVTYRSTTQKPYLLPLPPARSDPKPSPRGLLGLPIFDKEHSPQNIAAYAFLLGVVSGVGCALLLFCPSLRGAGVFLAALGVFHTSEYVTTAMYQSRVGLSAFLLDNGREYHLAMIFAMVEYIIERILYPSMKEFTWVNWLAAILVLVSQIVRSSAMITAGSNFSHIIEEEKRSSHKLVTTGIYSVFRHPSYTGFFYWGVMLQFTLANPIAAVGYVIVLRRFFGSRIEYEEMLLKGFFGKEYEDYRKRTWVLIPGL
ncbi:DUF1620 super [Borealophlyctis nickersoniae]|nr:DUF1620 super [Borealophlyctis nickersoniae]